MKIFSINEGNKFKEYRPQRFMDEHREETIETWLEENPDCIVENGGLLLIGRQVTTNLYCSIDLLGVDRDGNLAVVELKRDRTPRDTLAQALEYASFAATLKSDQLEEIYRKYEDDENASLVESHRRFFSLPDGEAISLNKNQRIVIVGSEITQAVQQSALFLRQKGIPITCLEFAYFRTGAGEQLLSIEIVVGKESLGPGDIDTVPLPKTDKNKFLDSCDDAGRALFGPLLSIADSEKLPIHWGSRGFSINLNYLGNEIALCFGYPKPVKPNQTPQSIYTGFREIARKVEGSKDLIENFKQKFLGLEAFKTAGELDLKYLIKEKPSPELVTEIQNLIKDLAQDVRLHASSDRN